MRYGPVDMPDVEALEDGVDDLEGADNRADNRSENEESENEEFAAAAAAHQDDQDEGGYGSDDLFSGYYEEEWEFGRNEGGDDSVTSHPLVTH